MIPAESHEGSAPFLSKAIKLKVHILEEELREHPKRGELFSGHLFLLGWHLSPIVRQHPPHSLLGDYLSPILSQFWSR